MKTKKKNTCPWCYRRIAESRQKLIDRKNKAIFERSLREQPMQNPYGT